MNGEKHLKLNRALLALCAALLLLVQPLLQPSASADVNFLVWRAYNPVIGNEDESYATTNAIGNHTINGKDSYCLCPFVEAAASYSEGTVDQIPDVTGRHIRSNMADIETAYQFAAAKELGWITKETAAEGIAWTVGSVQTYSSYSSIANIAKTCSEAYETAQKAIADHGGFTDPSSAAIPSFAGSAVGDGAWIFLEYQNGKYVGSVADANGVVGTFLFSNLHDGISYEVKDNGLYVSVPEQLVQTLFTMRSDGSAFYATPLVRGTQIKSGYTYEGTLWIPNTENHFEQPMVTATASIWNQVAEASVTLYIEKVQSYTEPAQATAQPQNTALSASTTEPSAAVAVQASASPTAASAATAAPQPTAAQASSQPSADLSVSASSAQSSTASASAQSAAASTSGQTAVPTVQPLAQEDQTALETVTADNQIVLQKVDAVSGIPVEGAQLVVYNAKNARVAQITTDSEGKASIPFTGKEDYTYRELTAPDGYSMNNDTYSFHVSGSGQISGTLLSKDTPLGTACIRVIDSEGTKIPGVVLAFYSSDGNRIGTAETDADGKAYYTPPSSGTYSFLEEEAPEEYEKNETAYQFTLDENGKVTGVTSVLNEPAETVNAETPAGKTLPWVLALLATGAVAGGLVYYLKRKQVF